MAKETTKAPGFVSLVGAGPGDPGLMTCKGAQRLGEADVIIHDELVASTLLGLANDNAEILHRRDVGDGSQEAINQHIVRLARHGKRVVRLKGGDPFVFGRGGEEAMALASGHIPFEVVPGVSAGIAVPAYAGIPLTHRSISSDVTFVTGHEDPNKESSSVNWKPIVNSGGTIVVFMGVRRLASIVEQMRSSGIDEHIPVAVVEWGTTPRQRTIVGDLSDIVSRAERENIDHPALTVVGRVVGLRESTAWFDRRPLWGRRVLVTRAKTQASSLVEALREVGAGVVSLPVIEFVPPINTSALTSALGELLERDRFDWVLFTSANAVHEFCSALKERNVDLRAFGNAKVACVGPSTAAALETYGIQPDVVPDDYRAEGLLDALPDRRRIRGKRFLFPRAEVARDLIPDALRERGGIVDVVAVYRTVRPRVTVETARKHVEAVDTVTFTSPSSVTHLMAMLGEDALMLLSQRTLAAIGPITAKTMEKLGLPVHTMARVSTVDGLVESIVEYASKQG